MGHVERQEQYYRDTYARAEDPSRTCNQARIDRLLQGGSDEVCLPPPRDVQGRPRMTVRELAEAQRGNIAGPTARHLAADVAMHVGIEVSSHALAAMATRAGMLTVGAALGPLGMALGIVLSASSVVSMAIEARHIDARDRAALDALAREWQNYQTSVDANARAIIEGRMHAMARGIEFVRQGRLDDPFVQRQIESDPYIRLGVRTALEAQSRANTPTAPAAGSNQCSPRAFRA
jgi:cell division protein FtsL